MSSDDVAKIYLAHHWGGTLAPCAQAAVIHFVLWCGASTSPILIILICTAAMSEPETAALATTLDNLNTGLFYYLSLHACDWLTP